MWIESIGDIGSVYGGYFGHKLSIDSPKEAWEKLRRIGVTQIIDLRYDYKVEDTFRQRCERYGMSYFNYPINNDPESIAKMADKFYDFSDLLIEGGFYMQGYHSSLVALSLYWVFGSNAGLFPMKVRKEVNDNAPLLQRTQAILHAYLNYKEEQDVECFNGKKYYETMRERIIDFGKYPYPTKVWYSIFTFKRAFRNESVVYDVSVEHLGVLGYLYPSIQTYDAWDYDIVFRPYSHSGSARCFEEAQLYIIKHLCHAILNSIKYPALPESTKMCIHLLRAQLE